MPSLGAVHFLAAGAIAVFYALSLGLGLGLLGDVYNDVDAELQQNSVLTAGATVGVALALVGCALGPLALGWLLVFGSSRVGRGLSSQSAAAISGAIAVGGIIACALSWAYFIVPGETYHRGTENNNQPDTLKQFLGGLIFAVHVPVVACAAVAATLLSWKTRASSGASSSKVATAPFSPPEDARHAVLHGGLGLFLLALLVTTATALCTPVWNFSSTSYFTSQVLDATGASYSLLDPSLKLILGPPPDDPTSWMQPIIYVKLYEDVVVYFSFLLLLAGCGILGTLSAPLRRILHKRVRVPFLPANLAHLIAPHGACCVGELLVCGATVGLYIYWVLYWTVRYRRITNEAAVLGDAHPRTHVAARVLGHLTTLTMSLLSFPVTRHSVWEAVFGIPFDRAIKYHRGLGSLCWLLVTLHMLLWQGKWLAEGNLINNVFAVRHLLITPCEAAALPCYVAAGGGGSAFVDADGLVSPVSVSCPCVFYNSTLFPGTLQINPADHADNFTIPIAEASWLLLTLALVVAVWWRRSHYEAFLYTHHAVFFFFAAGLVHAWSHWYYTAGGLILYAFDKFARGVKSTATVTALSLDAASPGIVRLRVRSDVFRGRPSYAGQYVWLNIPTLSVTQWHPFTIASAPATAVGQDGHFTIMVRALGASTWTGRLLSLALELEAAESKHGGGGGLLLQRGGGGGDANGGDETSLVGASLALSIDGPYGRPPSLAGVDTLILIAGGIGITPLHAQAVELCDRLVGNAAGVGSELAALRHVHLVWVVREGALVDAFAATLSALLAHPDLFTLHIHYTGRGGGALAAKGRAAAATSTDGLARRLLERGGEEEEASALPTATELGWCSPGEASSLSDIMTEGRPDVSALLASVASETRERRGNDPLSSTVLVSVCGPEGLQSSASQAALQHGAAFHSEVFHF